MGPHTARRVLALAFLFLVGIPQTIAAQDAAPQKIPRQEMIRALTTGTESQRLSAIRSLDPYMEHPDMPDLLMHVLARTSIGRNVSESTLELIAKLSGLEPTEELVEKVTDYLRSPNYRLQIIAADTLGEWGNPAALEGLMRMNRTPDYKQIYGVRKAVLQAIMKIKDPRSVEFLVAELPELDGQVEFEVVRFLSHVSLQQFATRAEDWQQWWDDNAIDFDYSDNADEYEFATDIPPDFHWDKEVAEFFGSYVNAKRLVFVIDISNSMKANLGGSTRMERAKEELIEAIDKLPDDTYFSMIGFHKGVILWSRSMLPATERNKARATKWVEDLEMAFGTASYDALERGFFVDGNTEAVFFLSDGRPYGGKVEEPGEIVRILTRENFFRRISVYSFGVGDGGAEQFMQDLADNNSGAYKKVR